MRTHDTRRIGVLAYARTRWGTKLVGAVLGPGILLAISVVIWQIAAHDQTITEAVGNNLAPIAIAGLLGFLLWFPAALILGFREQRDAAWRELDRYTHGRTEPPFLAITPTTSEKVGRDRYEWLTTAEVRHEMKIIVTNRGTSGRFVASARWEDNPVPWDIEWHRRGERVTRIPEGADAILVVALVGKRSEKWFAYGVSPGSRIGPRVEIDLDRGSNIVLTVYEEGVDVPDTTALHLEGPSGAEWRPRLSLITGS